MRLSLPVLATFLLVLSCPATGLCTQEQRKIVLSERQFRESYLDKVTVSGGIRAGFMYPSSLEHVDTQKLFIHLRQDVAESEALLCVNMVSRDGRYAASWEYGIGGQPAGAIGVSLPSRYQSQLADYNPEALVVLAGVTSRDCTSQEIRYTPASWGQATDSDYVLYVNSGNTETSIGIPGQTARIPCSRIKAETTVAYDTRCVVGREMLGEPKSIYLLRSNFGNKLPNVEFPVR